MKCHSNYKEQFSSFMDESRQYTIDMRRKSTLYSRWKSKKTFVRKESKRSNNNWKAENKYGGCRKGLCSIEHRLTEEKLTAQALENFSASPDSG